MSALRTDPSRRAPAATTVRQALIRFAASSAAALVLIGAGSVALAGSLAHETAMYEAQVHTASFAQNVVAPMVDQSVRRGPGPQSEALDEVLGSRLRDGSLEHIVLWSADGEVIWADEPALIGTTGTDLTDITAALAADHVSAEFVTAADLPFSGGQRPEEVLEVCVGTVDADGVPLVMEWYWNVAELDEVQAVVRHRLLPLAVGALLLFQVAVLPLAYSLARRVESAQAQHGRWRRHAMVAQDLERRRITQALHDGVIQDLGAVAYALPSISARLGPSSPSRVVLDEVTSVVRRDIAGLRALAREAHPPDLSGTGLRTAVAELARATAQSGVEVDARIDGNMAAVSPESRALVFRVVREGLRNVVKHSGADRALVRLQVVDARVHVSVHDDGGTDRPASPTLSDGQAAHLGIMLLTESVQEAGGTLAFEREGSHGATLRVDLPLDWSC